MVTEEPVQALSPREFGRLTTAAVMTAAAAIEIAASNDQNLWMALGLVT